MASTFTPRLILTTRWRRFSRNPATGALSFVEFKQDGVEGVDGLDGAIGVTISPDVKHLYAAGYFDDAVAAFSRNPTTGTLNFVELKKDGVGGVDGLDGGWSVTISLGGKHLYAASDLDKALAVFSRNTTTGELTFVEMHKDGSGLIDGLAGAASVIVSPNGNQVYVAGTIDKTVTMFSRNSATGELTIEQICRDGVGGVDGLDGASSIAISPDEKRLYASARDDDAVAVFSRSIPSADLEIVKTGSPDPVTTGTNLTYASQSPTTAHPPPRLTFRLRTSSRLERLWFLLRQSEVRAPGLRILRALQHAGCCS